MCEGGGGESKVHSNCLNIIGIKLSYFTFSSSMDNLFSPPPSPPSWASVSLFFESFVGFISLTRIHPLKVSTNERKRQRQRQKEEKERVRGESERMRKRSAEGGGGGGRLRKK